jgi:hypothetical protein
MDPGAKKEPDGRFKHLIRGNFFINGSKYTQNCGENTEVRSLPDLEDQLILDPKGLF